MSYQLDWHEALAEQTREKLQPSNRGHEALMRELEISLLEGASLEDLLLTVETWRQ
jgi:hypothetical protein